MLQGPVLVATIGIVLLGFFDVQESAKNIATKLTWSGWWPAVVVTFAVLGRAWCIVCPFGALNEAAARWSGARRLFPRALRGFWLATFIFVLLTWADEHFGIVRSPRLTAEFILFLASAALATGVVYQRRTFCRYLCPITGLQALYAMIAPIELRARERALCSGDCRQSCYRGSLSLPGCPMFEFPMSMERNAHCSFCLACVRTCPKSNVALRLRSLGADLWASTRRSLDEAYLALVLVGLTSVVTAQMRGAWDKWVSEVARLWPAVLPREASFTMAETTLLVAVVLAIAPLLGYAAAWAAFRIIGSDGPGPRRLLVLLGGMFAPIGLSMHLAHNVAALLVDGPGVIPALWRVCALAGLGPVGAIDWPAKPAMNPGAVHALQLTLVWIGLGVSIVAGSRSAAKFMGRQSARKALVPFIALAAFFTLINLYMLDQPTGARRAM